MSKSQETWNKKEREKQKQKIRKEKMERREERKGNAKKGKSLEEMMAYVDENGNISSTPPDPRRKKEIKAVDIEIGVEVCLWRDSRPIELEHLVQYVNDPGINIFLGLWNCRSHFISPSCLRLFSIIPASARIDAK